MGIATFAVSSVSLYALAVNCGIPEPLSAGLPIALDVGAAVGALAWITERDERREWGRVLALSALALSLAGNGVEHGLTLGLITVSLPLVLLVGASIPLVLFGVIHLAALMAKPAAPAKAAPKPRTRPASTPSPRSTETTTASVPTTPEQVNEVAEAAGKRERARTWALANWPCTGPQIEKATGVGRSEADRARIWAKDQKESQAS